MKKFAAAMIALSVFAFAPAHAEDAANIVNAKKLVGDLEIYAQKLAKKDHRQVVISAEAGQAFYTKKVEVKGKDVSCAACHTDNPANPGKHNETGKSIKPMSPAVNPDRFSSVQKAAKGFSKHCRDLYGKDCAPEDKASFIQYLLTTK